MLEYNGEQRSLIVIMVEQCRVILNSFVYRTLVFCYFRIINSKIGCGGLNIYENYSDLILGVVQTLYNKMW